MRQPSAVVFPVIMSAAFALIYSYRMSVDYTVHVVTTKNKPKLMELPASHIRRIIVIFLLTFLGHLPAFATTRELNQKIVGLLHKTIGFLVSSVLDILTLESLLVAICLFFAYISFQFFRDPKKFLKGPLRSLREPLEGISSLARDSAVLLCFAFCIGIIVLIFLLVNSLVKSIPNPNLKALVEEMVLSMVLVFIVAAGYPAIGTRLTIRKALKKLRAAEWESLWSQVFGQQVKEVVRYGLIFLFIPCLLYRIVALFKGSTDISGLMPYLLTLVWFHITGFVLGAFLDRQEMKKYRTRKYRRELYERDRQVDKVVNHTIIKDVGLIIPLVLFSWGYFLWHLAPLL